MPKTYKNARGHENSNSGDLGLKRLLPNNSAIRTFKTVSSHTSSVRTLNKDKLYPEEVHQETDKDEIHSSSSADTIPMKDKIVVPNRNKLKGFVDNISNSRSKENVRTETVSLLKI